MRIYLFLAALTAAALILTPAIALPGGVDKPVDESQTELENTVTVFLSNQNMPLKLPMTEYLVGAVSAEMPASYHPQALMAQAVACHTYALYRRSVENKSPTTSLLGADLSDDAQVHQGYLSEEGRKEKWGESFEANEAKVRAAVEEVCTKIMTYQGDPICAAFFAVSSGQTESALTVFGDDIPYLQSVPSDADQLSPDCEQTVTLSETEFAESMQKLNGVSLSDNADEWIGDQKTAGSGFVEEITVGGKTIPGVSFRKALSLRSAVFTVSRTESGFRIQTKGYGHLVGMSQYGANAMAADGADWRQILTHYYKGVTISDE